MVLCSAEAVVFSMRGLGPLKGGLRFHVVAVCHKTRQIRRGKRFHLLQRKRLDGIHVGVRHTGGTVRWDPAKAGFALTLHPEMLHRGHLVIALPVGLCPMPLIAALGGGGSIEYPKGDIDALQLLQMVFLPESLRQQRLAL